MNYVELVKLAESVGFDSQSGVAAAIAMAESGGNPQAHNNTPPDDSYGLWQINMLGSLGPNRRKRFKISSNTELFDPKVNARAAYTVYSDAGFSFRPWTTYTRGTYKKYLDLKEANTTSVPVEAVDKVGDVASAIPNAVNAFGQTFFKATSNLTGIIIAVVLLVLGVLVLLRNQLPAKKIVKAAKQVAK